MRCRPVTSLMSITGLDYVGNYVGNLEIKFWQVVSERLVCTTMPRSLGPQLTVLLCLPLTGRLCGQYHPSIPAGAIRNSRELGKIAYLCFVQSEGQ